MDLFRKYRLVFTYLLSEMTPTFFLGVITFVSILLMFQMLRLTELILQHDVSLRTLIHIMSYMSISFLPAILPMSLIFAIVLSYNRLTNDSEIIAFKSLGFSMWPLVFPGLALGLVIAMASSYTAFRIGPWGNRQFELLINDISNSKIITAIKEGTFSEGFFNLVVYTNSINPQTDELQRVFIYDERDPKSPTTIIAEKGQIFSEKSFDAYKAFIRLINGDIHKISEDGHTKIHFETYDLNITNPINKQIRNKSMESLTYNDLMELRTTSKTPEDVRKYDAEFYKRVSLSFACILFVLLGIGLGCRTNSRSGRSGGGVMSVGVIVVYWVLFIVGNSLAKNPNVPVIVSAWLPAFVLLPVSFWLLRRNWN
ncbi:MAG: LPS export ABC transporter permease LptF [Bdellovibrionales bacterium]|nr:LPS export ABC transporter permease LptF [Bdellovibrionales bacterium]